MTDVADRPVIRPLRASDRDALVAIDAPAGAVPSAAAPDTFGAHVQAGCSFVAELRAAPVGYLLAQPIAYRDDRPLTLWVEAVAVHPAYRRRGIAGALYREFGARARAAGATAVLTRVAPDDAAGLALHRRAGFTPHATGALIWRLDRA